MTEKKLQIRNSTAEFLIFTSQAGKNGIEVLFQNETIWLSQKMMAALFNCSADNISLHLKNIFKTKELDENSVAEDFSVTASDGKTYKTKHYNLDAIISVGYRVNSHRATQFRQWATSVLKDFAIRGYVLDKERLKNGAFLSKTYFDNLLAEIREIRASERNFYQKITDIYATAMDYNMDDEVTHTFFASVQNKLHFAIHGHTAAELIMSRANSKKEQMGLTTWKNAPSGKIIKTDVVIAKNYLTEKEIKNLDRFVTMYLDYAETQAERNIPMTMKDWAEKLNAFLQFNEKDILSNSGKVTQTIAKSFAESEFEKYRIVQDKLFESDFDKAIKKLTVPKKKKEE
ncbi:MAG TPA: virulence RhuM family protein [Bacteroidales bacterium]|nr:virulence RhuM family protein [Bacteroidales bacterium]